MPDHGHDVTMPARFGAQNAEAVPGLMIPAVPSCRWSHHRFAAARADPRHIEGA
jgi:hypothetical protein